MLSLEKGGLVVGSLSAFNKALLQKWHWRFMANENCVWVRLIKSTHGIASGFNKDENKSGYVGVWSKIVDAIIKMDVDNLVPLHTLKQRLGSGNSIGFWNAMWVGLQPLKNIFNRLYRLDGNPDTWWL